MHEGKEYEGDKVDIFSLGALLFVLMTKKFGFLKATIDNISMDYKKILYKLIKTKQYQKYWKILEKKCQINSFIFTLVVLVKVILAIVLQISFEETLNRYVRIVFVEKHVKKKN